MWKMKPSDAEAATQLAKSAEIPITIARLLIQRGIATPETAKTFLNPALEQLHSPFEMLGMHATVVRVQRAIGDKEPILIYGDYDVDGTTAVVILKTCIELLGGVADFHVPHRIREGYGMKDDVIENAAENGIKLVISVDTGIRAFQAAETARRVGLDLIVTDHHLPEIGESLPFALAVLNPNQPDCKYPCKDLCGAGVAFKIAQALLTEAGPQFERLIPSFIKMVAIATIADSVPLVGENRVFAKLGLDGLRKPVNGGLKALMQVAQLDAGARAARSIRATDIAFRVAPRINAAGRMDIAKDVVELFTTRDETRSRELAIKLNELNSDRQAEEARIIGKIHALLDNDAVLNEAFCLVIAGEGWHRGVIGIAATRLVERTGKPALVIAIDGDEAHGSGRSISAFHLLDALESKDCRPLFTRFGGHAHAVGFSMKREQVEPLRCALDVYARTRLTVEDFVPVLHIDSEVTLEEITPEWMRCLQMLEPYGMGNREPVFMARGLRIQQPPKVLKEKHIKLRLTQVGVDGKQHRGFDALGWRMAERIQEQGLVVGEMVDLAFTVEENMHPEFGGLQLIICDLVRAKAVASSQ
ncbi:MAG: exonuclease RecJ [Acidobacteriaceae bacterium]|nr:exonuclease RecJ [Acidobacteriaceae bacterium]